MGWEGTIGQFFFGQTDRQTDIVAHREVTLPITKG